jgi:hypothetical protein
MMDSFAYNDVLLAGTEEFTPRLSETVNSMTMTAKEQLKNSLLPSALMKRSELTMYRGQHHKTPSLSNYESCSKRQSRSPNPIGLRKDMQSPLTGTSTPFRDSSKAALSRRKPKIS